MKPAILRTELPYTNKINLPELCVVTVRTVSKPTDMRAGTAL